MDANVKVLSVVGAGRSGTTVLAGILGELDGVVSAGELRFLWERGLASDRPCGCGSQPVDCPVWGPVSAAAGRALAVDWPGVDIDTIIAAQHELKRRRNFPRVLRTMTQAQPDWPALLLVRAAIGAACLALAEVTSARIVVDTSKRPLDAAVLAGVPDIDHYVLHIVRDPRAVVHSWRRTKAFTAGGQSRTMGTRSLPSTTRRWSANCLSAEALRRRVPVARWSHLRYEDFADDPRSAVQAIVELLGEPKTTSPFLDDHTVLLHPNHIVAGNPSRFTTGPVTIRADMAWRSQMPVRDQQLVSMLTFPLLRRYGYRGRTTAATDRGTRRTHA